MVILFKNGKEVGVCQEIVDILNNKITNGGCGNFQSFTTSDGKTNMMINVSEIACIYEKPKQGLGGLKNGRQ